MFFVFADCSIDILVCGIIFTGRNACVTFGDAKDFVNEVNEGLLIIFRNFWNRKLFFILKMLTDDKLYNKSVMEIKLHIS